jgi:hypothetical protein
VKKLTTVLLVVLTACHNGTSAPSGLPTGGATPEAALNAYMAAVKARDLQAMSAAWGSAKGPARETMERVQMEKSETIVMGLFCDEEFRILRKNAGDGGREILNVELKRGTKMMTVNFTTIPGPAKRWYVEDVDLKSDIPQRLQNMCR